jgi:hypothetical protein
MAEMAETGIAANFLSPSRAGDPVAEILRLGAGNMPLVEQVVRFRQAFPDLSREKVVEAYQEAARRNQAETERLLDQMLALAGGWHA